MPKRPTASSSSGEPTIAPRRSAVLMSLVLVLVTLLLWQLQQQYAQMLDAQRQRDHQLATQLANQLNLNMEFKAHVGVALLQHTVSPPATAAEQQALLETLRGPFPALRSVAWLDAGGALEADTALQTPAQDSEDARFIVDLHQRNAGAHAHFAFSPQNGGQIYLLLRQQRSQPDSGYWLLRLGPQAVSYWLRGLDDTDLHWLLEDRLHGAFFGQPPLETSRAITSTEQERNIFLLPLASSDWQVHGLFDERRAQAQLLPRLIGEFLLFMLCAALALITLRRLHHDQRSLRQSNRTAQRALHRSASALGAIEEKVLITEITGRVQFLNPQAEQLFGLSRGQAKGSDLLQLLPDLDPRLLQASDEAPLAQRVTVRHGDSSRLLSVTRSALTEGQATTAYVWVLRDVTEQQHALQVLQDTQRRYQNIFQGTGIALCVLNLSGLRTVFQAEALHDTAALTRWLHANPQRHRELLHQLRITEANQVALDLLGGTTLEQAWCTLIGGDPVRIDGPRFRLLAAALDGAQHLELESRMVTAAGDERHLWLVLRPPQQPHDPQSWQAVPLSINDITERKHTELALIEREQFWSEVVRAVPDTLYVHDIPNQSVLFSNHHLGQQLGYDKDELKAMGKPFWEHVLHPDDAEYYWRIRNLQKVIGNGVLLESQLRWRHRNGRWHWFSIREQALSRDAAGRVSRLIGVAKDITEQIDGSESLRGSEQRYRLLAESITDVIFSTSSNLHLNYVSPSVQPILGYTAEWIISHGFDSIVANPRQLAGLSRLIAQVRDAFGDSQRLAQLREQLPPQLFLFDCLNADGRKLPVELRIVLMWSEQGRFEGLLGVGRDISQQRRAEKDLRMAATVFEHSTAAILVTDPAGYIVQVNEAFSRVSGYSSAEVLDQLPSFLTADRQQASQLNYIMAQLNLSGSWEGEVWLKRKAGDSYPAWVGITAVHDEEGDLVSYVCFYSDISERKASEQRIHRLAYYDALTQLPNRTLFQDRLHSALQHAQRQNGWVVLMFLDLDRFKPINDSLGHAAGDRMLKDVALRLSACVDADDTVARMGGDEFTLLLHPCATREGALNRAIHVAEKILVSQTRAFILEGREFFVTASIGIALSPQDGNELSQLMKNADTAMYHAKERGKNNFQFYQADMNASALERLELENDLRRALEHNEFLLHYQPQFASDGKRLTGVEALLRWQHPRRGLIAPTTFIPVLEELGLVVQVGEWVLIEACRQLKNWQASGVRVPKISVNLSARQFGEGQLDTRIAAILQDAGVAPACLELELTESILMRDVSEAMRILAGFKKLGVSIAVDDFGTGYSSLNYLKQFPIDVLKIDRSFVDGLPDGEQDAQIARAIIAMAHSLKLLVIAEGVETQEQLDFLREHGCDEVQGYLLGRPMPAQQLTAQFSGAALFIL